MPLVYWSARRAAIERVSQLLSIYFRLASRRELEIAAQLAIDALDHQEHTAEEQAP
jgi:hypothetical protein